MPIYHYHAIQLRPERVVDHMHGIASTKSPVTSIAAYRDLIVEIAFKFRLSSVDDLIICSLSVLDGKRSKIRPRRSRV